MTFASVSSCLPDRGPAFGPTRDPSSPPTFLPSSQITAKGCLRLRGGTLQGAFVGGTQTDGSLKTERRRTLFDLHFSPKSQITAKGA
jgi:hypothetical protein